MTSSFLSANTLIGATYPIVAIPPKKPYRSTIAVFAPCRAAAIAAIESRRAAACDHDVVPARERGELPDFPAAGVRFVA